MKRFACSLPEESRKTFAMIVLTEGVSSNEKKKGSLGRVFVGGHVLQEFFPKGNISIVYSCLFRLH